MFLTRFLAALSFAGLAFGVHTASAQEPDSTSVEQLQEVVVSAVRASKDAPFAVANINRTELQEFSSTGRELPLLCAHALCPAASSATARAKVWRICRVCFIINTNG